MANVAIKDRRRRDAIKAGALLNAMDSSGMPSITTDEKGVIQIFSAGAQRMLGYTESEVASKRTPADLCDPLEAAERAAALGLEFATAIAPGFEALVFKASRGIEDRFELTWMRKDGSRLAGIVSVTALRDARGEIIGYLLIVTDNAAQESFRRTVESVTDCGIVQLDAQGQVLSWNAGAQVIDGYSAQEILGQPFSRFYCAEDVERGVPQHDLDAAAATGRHESEGRRMRKDRSIYRANTVLTPVHDRAGVLRGFARLTRAASDRTEPHCEMQAASRVPDRRLLYVEDDVANIGLVEELVARRSDVLVLRAADVNLGIHLARTARPEVILLNIDLPGIGAHPFMKLLRADPVTQDMPLLALGANAAPDAITKALEAGFFHYLTKPLKPEPFMQALDDALQFAALERAERDQRAFTSAHSH